LEQWMDDIRTVLDAAGAERAVVFAHGDGGPMAMLFAATYPERTAGLVVADGAARKLRAPDYPHGIPLKVAPRHLAGMIAEWGTGDAVRIGAPSMAGEASRRWRARLERLAMSPSQFAGEYPVALNADVRPILETIRVPTLELGRFRGREIHTTGDGFFATFDGPARAVRCALAIREAVRPLGLEIRAGLHTGECELRGDDVSGIAVHIGARVAAAANAGEVL